MEKIQFEITFSMRGRRAMGGRLLNKKGLANDKTGNARRPGGD